MWKCQCDCGNIVEIPSESLLRSKNPTKSCGCLQREKACLNGKSNGKNLIGQTFGKLTPIQLLTDRTERTYLCKCECGNEIVATSKTLINRHKSSCGCLKKSLGEYTIEKILKENNKQFITQYHNNNCRYPDTNYYAYFDFYVENKYIIEFDGEQHYSAYCFNGISNIDAQKQFQKTKQHDKYKNDWCKQNNIPIIRIPYTKLRSLTIQDLLLETSEYII